MMFSLPSPLTSPRTDDAVCVPDVDWDGAAALVVRLAPLRTSGAPDRLPIWRNQGSGTAAPKSIHIRSRCGLPGRKLPEEVGPTICTSEPPEEEFPELPPEDMPGPVAGPLELLPEETPLPIELE